MASFTKTIVEITRPEKKNPFVIFDIIKRVLYKLELKTQNRFGIEVSSSALTVAELSSIGHSVFLRIPIGDRTRNLSVHFDCDHDSKHLCDSSIIFLLGDDQEGQLIIREIGKAMKDYDGRVWFLPDSYSDFSEPL